MPSLSDFGRFFAAVTAADVIIGVAVTCAILVLLSDWRLSLIALTVQYLMVTVLLSTIVQLEVAMVRLIGGGLVAVMLYMTAQRVRRNWMRRARSAGWRNASEVAVLFERESFMIGWPFRLIALALVAVSVVTLGGQLPFPNAPVTFWVVSLWLCTVGILLAAITRDALKLGMGLLTFTMGFGLLYLSIEPSLLFFGLLLVVDLVIALAVSHLASTPVRTGTRRRREI